MGGPVGSRFHRRSGRTRRSTVASLTNGALAGHHRYGQMNAANFIGRTTLCVIMNNAIFFIAFTFSITPPTRKLVRFDSTDPRALYFSSDTLLSPDMQIIGLLPSSLSVHYLPALIGLFGVPLLARGLSPDHCFYRCPDMR